MSLKENPTPINRSDKLGRALLDVEKGKKGAKERLYKFVESGVIPTEVYENYVKQHETPPSSSPKDGASITELLKTIEDYKNGTKNSEKQLYKYVEKGTMRQSYYDQVLKKHGFMHRMNRAKMDREKSRKIKAVLCGIVASVVLLVSMACGVGYSLVEYGKGIAIFYFLLWVWAIDYVIAKDTKSEKISKLEWENKTLKDRIDFHGCNKDMRHKEDEITNLKKEIVRLENIRASDNKLIELLKSELEKARNNVQ